MDACAPPPSCGSPSSNASNIWFKFYASASTVTISCFQNTSFVIGVQAFSGEATCGSLTQIGCAIAGGPSSGVNLTISGLTVGELYYYRIFGSSVPISQRTGIYCFCGTTGLDNYILASGLKNFKGNSGEHSIKLMWEVSTDNATSEFNIEVSTDKVVFNTLSTIPASHNRNNYSYTFEPADNNDLYYRLRYVNTSGEVVYSPILKLKTSGSADPSFAYLKNSRQLKIVLDKPSSFLLCNTSGSVVKTYNLKAGENLIGVQELGTGVYFVRDVNSNRVKKFALSN